MPPREKAMIELLVDSGIRLSELSNLMVDNIDTTIGKVKVFGKGSKERCNYWGQVKITSFKRALLRLDDLMLRIGNHKPMRLCSFTVTIWS